MFGLIPASKEAINEENSATCGMCDKYYNNTSLKCKLNEYYIMCI
jgi:hypothetical protein